MDSPTPFDPGRWAQPHLADARPYVPGEQPDRRDWIKLNTNENPFPPSPKVEAAIRTAMESLRYYPRPDSGPLREKIAAVHGVSRAQVIAGNGSDDLLNLLIRVFGAPDQPVGAMDPGYSLYPVLCRIQNAPFVRIPYRLDMKIPVEQVAASGCHLFLLTSPNAPTGVGYSTARVAELAAAFPGVLVVDEAYAAFAEEDAVPLLKNHPNVVVTRSFSKSHGLAGLRVGYALGSPAVVALLDRVRDSYNLDALAQAGALAALEDPDYYRGVNGKVVNTRDYYLGQFRKLGWRTFDSAANFICTEPVDGEGRSGREVAAACFHFLKEQKILVRFFPDQELISGFLRISVGNEDEMDALHEAVLAWMQG